MRDTREGRCSGSYALDVQALKGPIEVGLAVIKGEGGVLGLYKGTVSTLIREVPGNAAMFGTYEVVKQWMARQQVSVLSLCLIGGSPEWRNALLGCMGTPPA